MGFQGVSKGFIVGCKIFFVAWHVAVEAGLEALVLDLARSLRPYAFGFPYGSYRMQTFNL